MRLFVIFTVVTAAVAIPIAQRSRGDGTFDSQDARIGDSFPPGSLPKPPTNNRNSEGVLFPGASLDDIVNSNTPGYQQTPNAQTPKAFQDLDAAQIIGDGLNNAWDISAKVFDTIGKYTPLGAAATAVGTGGAALLDTLGGVGGGVPLVPDVGAFSGN